MFSFLNKVSLENIGFLNTDYHSHILPGVDDGAQTLSDSLELLSCLEQSGVETIWLTPHIMEHIPNSTERLQQKFQELKDAYSGQIQLHLAAEYMLDQLFLERFDAADLLPLNINDTPNLLIEISCFRPPVNFHKILELVKSKGYYPVLAHPERYIHLSDNDYRELKEMGVKFQLNLFSLVGGYGPHVERKAKWLLKNEMYDISGTDTHRMEQIEKYSTQKISATIASIIGNMNTFC